MRAWTHDAPGLRLVVGAGTVDGVADEARRTGARRVLLIASPSARVAADRVATGLGGELAARIDEVAAHVPLERAEAARALAREHRVDGVVAVGGGSAVGLGKAVALTERVPVVAVPTTLSGSEMTPVHGHVTPDRRKVTGRDEGVRPVAVVLDPELVATMPAALTAASGLNAMAHAVEALWADGGDPIVHLLAGGAIRDLGAGLSRTADHPDDLAAREATQVGAALAGRTLASVAPGLHHRICHTLGGLGAPHAAVHAVILPHSTAFNRDAAPAAMAVIVRALGLDPGADAPGALRDLADRLGAPVRLEGLGLAPDDLAAAAALVAATPPPNPRPVTEAGVRALLDDAWAGRRPGQARVAAGRGATA